MCVQTVARPIQWQRVRLYSDTCKSLVCENEHDVKVWIEFNWLKVESKGRRAFVDTVMNIRITLKKGIY